MKLFNDQSGAAAAEYALILALIGVGIIAASMALQGAITGVMTEVGDCISTRGANC